MRVITAMQALLEHWCLMLADTVLFNPKRCVTCHRTAIRTVLRCRSQVTGHRTPLGARLSGVSPATYGKFSGASGARLPNSLQRFVSRLADGCYHTSGYSRKTRGLRGQRRQTTRTQERASGRTLDNRFRGWPQIARKVAPNVRTLWRSGCPNCDPAVSEG